MKKVNLFIIAINKYTCYLQQLVESADKFFLPDQEVTYCVFTDKDPSSLQVTSNRKIAYFGVLFEPWPHPTLMRFHFFLEHQKSLPEADFCFYVDIDATFVDTVGTEVLGDLVAVEHCGFIGERGTYETRPQSSAYIAPNKGNKYYGGGFMGGAKGFWAAVAKMASNIDKDTKNKIVACHNDESHWNKYLSETPPTVELNPSYHHPDKHEHIYGKWKARGLWFPPKILLLNKDHEAMRK